MTAEIIMFLAILVFVGPVVALIFSWLGTIIVRRRQIAAHRNREPVTYGDSGGVPLIEKRGHVTRMPR